MSRNEMKFENKDGMICFSRIIELAAESEAMKQKELEKIKKEESFLGNADYLPSFLAEDAISFYAVSASENITIHTTVGVYPNMPCQMNGVKDCDLLDHVQYNKAMRPDRALLVDGKVVHAGCFSDEEILMLEEKFGKIVCHIHTIPYR